MKNTDVKPSEHKDEEALRAAYNVQAARKEPSSETQKDCKTPRDKSHRLVGYTRFMAAVPSFGLFIAAIAMTIATLLSTIGVTVEVVKGELTMQDMLVEYIEYADFFLLSIVLYIMSIGLYSLFIDDDIEMPSWLEIHTLDDLKEKLVSVIVVVMGVFFLGRLIHGADSLDLLCMGAGIGAVVLSMAYFVRYIMVAHKREGEEE